MARDQDAGASGVTSDDPQASSEPAAGPSASPSPADDATTTAAAGEETDTRLLVSSFFTLTLAILGSSVLPVPFAWARAGLIPGLIVMAVVAAANACACRLLMSAARETGHDSYDGVAFETGGKKLKIATQASLVLLLFGTVAGDIALLADVAPRALQRLTSSAKGNSHFHRSHSHPHSHHHDHQSPSLPGGRTCATILTLVVVTPLCFLRRMRSLETAAAGGVLVVAVLVGSVVASASTSGAPALTSGEFPIWKPVSPAALPEFAAVAGYAFYLAPVLFPLLHELPPSPRGPKLASGASRAVTLFVAPLVYGALGIAGAARYGLSTAQSLLGNEWLGGGRADGLLDAAAVAYLSISVPPMQLSLRYTLETLVAGENAPPCERRRLILTAVPLALALVVALAFPASEKIFAITGALPVCLVCYVLPAVIHLTLLFRPGGGGRDLVRGGGATRWRIRRVDEEGRGQERTRVPLLSQPSSGVERPRRNYSSSAVLRWYQLASEVLMPVAMATLGVATSLAAAYLSVAALVRGGGKS